MSLNWNVSNVREYKALHDSEDEWNITDGLIWATMVVGLDEITEKNVPVWLERLTITDAINGGPMMAGVDSETGKMVEMPFTEEMLVRRIGMHTNATRRTDAEFFKGIKRIYLDNIARRRAHPLKEA